jgi:hypothetical protein
LEEEMEPSEEEEEASFMIPPGSSKPVLERSNSSTGTWSPHVRDLYILSFSFFFTFLAYVALQNLESSLHEVSFQFFSVGDNSYDGGFAT